MKLIKRFFVCIILPFIFLSFLGCNISEEEFELSSSENEEQMLISTSDENNISEEQSNHIENIENTEEVKRVISVEGESFRYDVCEVIDVNTTQIKGWEISIYKEEELIQIIEHQKSQSMDVVPDSDDIICVQDVNFDGTEDLLIIMQYEEKTMIKTYMCYLAKADLFTLCPGFSMIQNPKVEESNKLIVGEFYHHGNFYSKRYYKFNGEIFEMVQEDLYKYDEEKMEYVFEYSFDSTIQLFTETDYAISGEYKGLKGARYSINIYSGVTVEEVGNEIGNIYVNDSYYCLYKIDEMNYYVANGYYLCLSSEENVWMIRMYDKNDALIDELTMVQHYES